MSRRLLLLYPEAWRERYGAEMAALLDETPPSATVTVDLMRGALLAHLRPLRTSAPALRARGTIGVVLGCFIVFCLLGAGFAKTTENFGYSEHVHPVLGASHWVVLIGAVLATGALGLGAVPLAIASLAQARRTRDPVLIKLIAVTPAAVAIFAASGVLLVLWLNAHHHRAGAVAWLLLGLSAGCATAAGFACWAAPRAIMRRLEAPRSALRVTVPAIALVALCMIAVAVATGVFLVGILADSPRLGALSNGPGQLIDVSSSIAIQFTAMLALSVGAVVSATRGLRSVNAL